VEKMKQNYSIYYDDLGNCPETCNLDNSHFESVFKKFAHFYLPEPDDSGLYTFNEFGFNMVLDSALNFSRDWSEHLIFFVLCSDGPNFLYDYDCGRLTVSEV
jgi:hypothetical protein